jgi:hypothetical protein
MGGRSRLFLHQIATATQTEVINLTQVMPYNATLIQFSLASLNAPDPADELQIGKVSVVDPALNVTLRTFTPGEAGVTDFVCTERFEFRRGDTFTAVFANSADTTVGFEAVFKEVD